MNHIIILTILFLIPTSWVSADEVTKPKAKVATATVSDDTCVFTFPIENVERVWKWGVSPDNQCEYSWMVTVKGDGATYGLGFSYFNLNAAPDSGTFKELLSAGQANVWELTRDGKGWSTVNGVMVDCQLVDNALYISIDNKKWIKELFSRKPESLKFETSGTQLKAGEVDIKVVYKKAAEKKEPAQQDATEQPATSPELK